MSNIKLETLPYYIGYLPDPKDTRDYTLETFSDPSKFVPLKNASSEQELLKQDTLKANERFAQALNEKFNINDTPITALDFKYDFIKYLTSIRNQSNLGSCTAF